ncbi:alpha-(1,3)-fucosyltransferase C [Drosophila willistoni]|uniref:alpha-(1,3)-fucosyltransferase C n=1 Tax=Drosophila willistoni TaxID=7260 RepID=UPI00017D6857|nr:alpha-(1,3)-fucosyltransferase C [Drosophila willistoni]
MPIDKIRNTPVDKILSYRRNPQQQGPTPGDDDTANCPYYLPSHLNKRSEAMEHHHQQQQQHHKDDKDTDSFDTDDSDTQILPPPRRSPVSRANLHRQFTTHKHCIQAIKFFVCIVIICGLLRLVPYYQRADAIQPTILLWNDNAIDGARGATSELNECGCLMTTRRNYTTYPFDAVVINADIPYTINGMDMVKHKANYIVVFMARKPLSLLQNPLNLTTTITKQQQQVAFNFTMTYRLDSDLVWTDHYFTQHQRKRRITEFTKQKLNFNIRMMTARQASVLETHLKSKRYFVMYLMYEVNDYSLPESLYLIELRKHIDLYALDNCRTFNDCSLYRFMLVFDSSGCTDYIHPDFFTALDNYVVPVMVGGGNISHLVPPHSYISSMDFDTPKDLVIYLENLAMSNQQRDYEKYFWWHTNYKLQKTNTRPYCLICHEIREMSQDTKRDSSRFTDWWHKSQCNNRTL